MRPLVAVCTLFLVACAGEPTPPAPPEPAPEAPPAADSMTVPDIPLSDVSAERKALEAPPPPPGAVTRAFEQLAAGVGAGVVRCPLVGGGRGEVMRGRASDHTTAWGLPIEVEDGSAPPWSPALDHAGSESEWVTFLAAPGDTSSTVTTRTRTLRYEHPAAVAGATVACTAVHPSGSRVVRGRIGAPRPDGLLLLPCLSPPPPIGSDGTFAALVPTPCRLWVEGGGTKSEQVEVKAGNGPLDVTLHLEPDPMQKDGKLSPEALATLVAYVEGARARDRQANELIKQVRAAFPDDKPVQTLTAVIETELRDRTMLADKAERSLKGESP
jgi:hypothetical protein